MRKWLRVMFDSIKVFILFTGCTVMFYYGIMLINQEYENFHRYDEPEGSAIKVSTMEEQEYNWFDRLKVFYQYGE
jgi:hypothetical protein